MGRVTHHIRQRNCSAKNCPSHPDCSQCNYKRAATIVTCKEVGLDFGDLVFPDLPPDPSQHFEEECDTKGHSMNEVVKLGGVGDRGSRKLRWLDQQEQQQEQQGEQQDQQGKQQKQEGKQQQCSSSSSNHQDTHLSTTTSNCCNIGHNCPQLGPTINTTTHLKASPDCIVEISQEATGHLSDERPCANEAGDDQVSGGLVEVPEAGVNKGVSEGTLEETEPEGLPIGEGGEQGQHLKGGYLQLQTSDFHTLQDQDINTNSTMSTSDVPLVVLTTCVSEETTDTAIDDDMDDLRDIRNVNEAVFATARELLNNSDLVVSTDDSGTPLKPDNQEPPQSAPPTTSSAITTSGRRKHHRDIRRSASVRSEGPPSYHSIFSSDSKTRLSLTSARDAFRRLSDVWRQGSPRNSMTSVYPESPTSVTTLTGFIIRDKNAEGETQTRQVCLALRYLATGSNFSLVADYQGVSIPTVSRSVSGFTDFLYDEAYKYVRWPETVAEKESIVREFYEQYGYPRVLGLVDGSHIAIRKPLINEAAYVNRKGWHSLNAMVFRLAAVLLVCGIAISVLETVTSLHREAMVTGYPYAGIGAGIFIACTGVLGILAVTRNDCPHKYFSFYKGLSLISLLMGVVVLCGTLANLDVRWLSQQSQAANVAEIVLYVTKVLLAGVDIAAALASIYI